MNSTGVNQNVAGILIGSLPLEGHIIAVKIAMLTRLNLETALSFLEEDYVKKIFSKYFIFPPANKPWNKEEIIERAELVYNATYKAYFEQNPGALRYNLWLSASSIYFKSAILLAKQIEKTYSDFQDFQSFLDFLKDSSCFPLKEQEYGRKYLSARLDETFNNIFSEGMNKYSVPDTAHDVQLEKTVTEGFIKRKTKITIYDCRFANIAGEKLIKNQGSVDGRSFFMKNLKSCYVFILDHTLSVSCSSIIDCEIFIGPVMYQLYLEDCNNSAISAACGCIRIKNCTNLTLFLYCNELPIVENSADLVFAPYNFFYKGLFNHFKLQNKNIDENSRASFKLMQKNVETGLWSECKAEVLDPSKFRKVIFPENIEEKDTNYLPLSANYKADADSIHEKRSQMISSELSYELDEKLKIIQDKEEKLKKKEEKIIEWNYELEERLKRIQQKEQEVEEKLKIIQAKEQEVIQEKEKRKI